VSLELDLIGRKVTIHDGGERLLLQAAEASSGTSVGSRDLATRLKDISGSPPSAKRRLVLSRSESRALQRVLQARKDHDEAFHDLSLALSELLAGP
jgi:hypothetical protein